MMLLNYNQINLDHTINSGQVFLWKKHEKYWYGINGQDVFKVNESNATISTMKKRKYDLFRNNDNLENIFATLKKDKTLQAAISEFNGLRILRQDPFQCTISFIVSANSNIQRIKNSLTLLCRNFGERVIYDNKEFFLFPEPKKIAKADISKLARCGFGYRTIFVKNAANAVLNNKIDYEELKSILYDEAKRKIMEISGIGNKVADCILLFSLEHLDAFPLDRWIIKVLQSYYSNRFTIETKSITPKQYDLLHEKIVDYFGPYAGYAQQFLFKMERDNNQKKWL